MNNYITPKISSEPSFLPKNTEPIMDSYGYKPSSQHPPPKYKSFNFIKNSIKDQSTNKQDKQVYAQYVKNSSISALMKSSGKSRSTADKEDYCQLELETNTETRSSHIKICMKVQLTMRCEELSILTNAKPKW